MKEEVLALLKDEFSDIDFEASETLVDDGILDSLTVTGIIMSLTMAFDINISYDEISPENFNSIDRIVAMVERLKNA